MKMFSLYLEKWYHGRVTNAEAGTLLQKTKKGSFLLRCSCQKGNYTLSFLKDNNESLAHVRIVVHRGVLDMRLNGVSHLFEDEWDLIKHCRTFFDLDTDCPGSKFYQKFKALRHELRYLNDQACPVIDSQEIFEPKPIDQGVYNAIFRKEAVKVKEFPSPTPQSLPKVIAKLVKMPKNEYIVEIKGVATSANKTEHYIVSKLFDAPNLSDLINNNYTISLATARTILTGVAAGIQHLMLYPIKQVRYYNLYPKNILLDPTTFQPKLDDFAILTMIEVDASRGESNITKYGNFLRQVMSIVADGENPRYMSKLRVLYDSCLYKDENMRPDFAMIRFTLDNLYQ